MTVLGADIRGGRAETAPTIDNVKMCTQELGYKAVRFNGAIHVKYIEGGGKARPVEKKKLDIWKGRAGHRGRQVHEDGERQEDAAGGFRRYGHRGRARRGGDRECAYMVIEVERDKEETEDVRMGMSMMRNKQAQPQRRRPTFQANIDGDENCQGSLWLHGCNQSGSCIAGGVPCEREFGIAIIVVVNDYLCEGVVAIFIC